MDSSVIERSYLLKKPAQPILYAVCWYYVMASIPQSSQDYHESVSYYFM